MRELVCGAVGATKLPDNSASVQTHKFNVNADLSNRYLKPCN